MTQLAGVIMTDSAPASNSSAGRLKSFHSRQLYRSNALGDLHPSRLTANKALSTTPAVCILTPKETGASSFIGDAHRAADCTSCTSATIPVYSVYCAVQGYPYRGIFSFLHRASPRLLSISRSSKSADIHAREQCRPSTTRSRVCGGAQSSRSSCGSIGSTRARP